VGPRLFAPLRILARQGLGRLLRFVDLLGEELGRPLYFLGLLGGELGRPLYLMDLLNGDLVVSACRPCLEGIWSSISHCRLAR
jgi:hypothetical protein